MIVLFTDFNLAGPYVGQMKAVLAARAPGVPVIDLLHDAPAFEPKLAAYLLAAYGAGLPAGSTFLCVVDPGVGDARDPLVLDTGQHRFIGPDNGLLAIVARRAARGTAQPRWWRIDWRPERLSASFHGRDLFAPVAAMLALGTALPDFSVPGAPPLGTAIAAPAVDGTDWPDDLPQVATIDGYGNAVTGLRASAIDPDAAVSAGGRVLPRARTFADLPAGEPFWYENSSGLAEIAVNRGNAAALLGLAPGSPIGIE